MTYSVVALVVILLTAFILFNLWGTIKKAYAEESTKQICTASVQTHAKLKLRYADFSGEIKCPTVKLKIEDKNEGSAKNKIADVMYDCWDQFGRGKLDLFSGDSVYCSICHRITFDKDVKINGFISYLAEHNAPGQKVSYTQFLTTEMTQNSQFLNELKVQKIPDSIDASKQNEYAVIFTYIKGKKYLDEYIEKTKHISGGLGTIAVGFGIVKAGAAIGITGIGAPVAVTVSSFGGFVMSVGALWGFMGSYFAGVPFEHIQVVNLIPYDAENIKSLNCREIPIKQ